MIYADRYIGRLCSLKISVVAFLWDAVKIEYSAGTLTDFMYVGRGIVRIN